MSLPSDLHQALFHAVGDAMFVVEEATLAVLEANERASSATGYTRGELIGLSLHRLLEHNPSLEHRQPICLVTKDGRSVEAVVATTRFEWNRKALLIITARESEAVLPCAASTGDASGAASFPAIIGQSEKIVNSLAGRFGRQKRRYGVDSGRKRRRQGGIRSCHPLPQPPSPRSLRKSELRRAHGDAARKRAVRARQGRVHRSHFPPPWQIQAGPWRHTAAR